MNGENAIHLRQKPIESRIQLSADDPMILTWKVREAQHPDKVVVKSFINRQKQKCYIVTVYK